VLPISWFKGRKTNSISGAAFRRYFRLMMPLFIILSIYYLVAKFDLAIMKGTLSKVKHKSFLQFVLDCMIGVWFMNTDICGPTWTLAIELFASYWIFLVSFVVIQYRGRYWIYFLIFCFLYIPRITDAYHYTNYGFQISYTAPKSRRFDLAIRENMPTFIWGILFCDLEHDKSIRRLDSLRNLEWYFKIPINASLFILFIFYGSVDTDRAGDKHPDLE
jgi:peptidoglycan/LPS O-acetylase OafA/YrhL